MTLQEIEECFGCLYRATEALGIARQNITKWRKKGYIPYAQQCRLQKLTGDKLKADEYINRRKRQLNQIGD